MENISQCYESCFFSSGKVLWTVFPENNTFTQCRGCVSTDIWWLSNVLFWNRMGTCGRTGIVSSLFGVLQWASDAAIATDPWVVWIWSHCIYIPCCDGKELYWWPAFTIIFATPDACSSLHFCHQGCISLGFYMEACSSLVLPLSWPKILPMPDSRKLELHVHLYLHTQTPKLSLKSDSSVLILLLFVCKVLSLDI